MSVRHGLGQGVAAAAAAAAVEAHAASAATVKRAESDAPEGAPSPAAKKSKESGHVTALSNDAPMQYGDE